MTALDNEPWKRNAIATESKSGKVNNHMANALQKITGIADNERAFKWQKECCLKIKAEALITTDRDQAMNTKHHQTQILGINNDSKCYM